MASPTEFDTDLPRHVADPFAAANNSPRGDAQLSVIAGERASQGPGNKIVTSQGKTHFAWQDSYEQRYFARVRTLDHETGTWTPSVTLAEGVDEHSRPTLAIDSQGYLHTIMGGHNSPLQYRRSIRPHDSSEWTPTESFGKNTHPVLLCGPDDTLYLAALQGQVMPSIERPNGPNRLLPGTRPSFIYALGADRYAEEGETINNELWWVRVSAEPAPRPCSSKAER